MKLTRNAASVLVKRYLKRDSLGRIIEGPEDMFRRVADIVASPEKSQGGQEYWSRQFFRMMTDLEFLPNSPTLLNAGRSLGLLSSCFVLPVDDSIESISRTLSEAMIIHKYGGGTGFSFSRIRPKGDLVSSSNQHCAGGPQKLIEVFSKATEYVRQADVRCGCNSASLPVNHPDILSFIQAKNENGAANFATNIEISDDFMEKAKLGGKIDLINPRNGEISGQIEANVIFYAIAESAWRTGDPGIMFIDRINAGNPTPLLGKFETTDPCGGQLLLPYESSTLGTINISRLITQSSNGVAIDFTRLGELIPKAVRFLDDVLEVNRYPLEDIERAAKATRKIGLGLMGFADLLLKMGVRYDSEEALQIADTLMRFIREKTYEASEGLARERGSFPAFGGSVFGLTGGHVMRNASCLTFTNTGTTSIIANTSSGIHPNYAMVMVRNILDGERLLDINPVFEEMAIRHGFLSLELIEELLSGVEPVNSKHIPPPFRDRFTTAGTIEPEWCIRMQAVFQKYTDNAISQTVNFPHTATVDDIKEMFLKAYELGLKGVTAYRDRSRDLQVLCTGESCIDVARSQFRSLELVGIQ
ncbi:MAG: adenosylcobalamin-dependent ribonucleoside-diphosphate reductase [Dehalogenimonas sp.]